MRSLATDRFLFATGIECSNPLIQGRSVRRDLLEECGHLSRWQEDLDLVQGLGIRHLRYGLPIHRVLRGPDDIDWSFPNAVLPRMRDMGIEPILDLLHFGLPDWLGDFQNPEFPAAFARYAGAVAATYPWVRFWTPVNEIFVTAKLSAREGLWNEQERDETAFLRALLNLVKASLLATEAIVRHIPDAVIMPSESVEVVHSTAPEPSAEAVLYNQLRFLSLDLLYGRPLDPAVRAHLLAHGVQSGELAWFKATVRPGTHVLGLDYYGHNEFLEHPCGQRVPASDDGVLGFARLGAEYHDRYRLPMVLTETNYWTRAKCPQWLWKMWLECLRLRASGVPLIGFCWYSLGDQMDWHIALSERRGQVNGCGLYDLDRIPNPVEPEFRRLLRDYADMPLFPPGA